MRRNVLTQLVLLLAAALPAAATDRLVVKEEAYVRGPKVLLGDIARIEGDNAADLALIELSAAANPGDSKQLNAALIAARLENAGYDTLEVQVEGAPKVRATTLHLEVTPAQVSESLRDFVLTEMPWDLQDATVDIQVPQATLLTPDGQMDIQWVPSPQYRYIGSGAFRGTISVNGEVQKTMIAKATVEAFGEVLVARRDLQRGALISANDVEARKVSLLTVPDGSLQELEEVIGHVAKKTILAGQPLTSRHLDLPLLVKRNQVVPVELSMSGVFVQSRGRALMDGRVGDHVVCANLDSKDQFQGVVREDGVVVVE